MEFKDLELFNVPTNSTYILQNKNIQKISVNEIKL